MEKQELKTITTYKPKVLYMRDVSCTLAPESPAIRCISPLFINARFMKDEIQLALRYEDDEHTEKFIWNSPEDFYASIKSTFEVFCNGWIYLKLLYDRGKCEDALSILVDEYVAANNIRKTFLDEFYGIVYDDKKEEEINMRNDDKKADRNEQNATCVGSNYLMSIIYEDDLRRPYFDIQYRILKVSVSGGEEVNIFIDVIIDITQHGKITLVATNQLTNEKYNVYFDNNVPSFANDGNVGCACR